MASSRSSVGASSATPERSWSSQPTSSGAYEEKAGPRRGSGSDRSGMIGAAGRGRRGRRDVRGDDGEQDPAACARPARASRPSGACSAGVSAAESTTATTASKPAPAHVVGVPVAGAVGRVVVGGEDEPGADGVAGVVDGEHGRAGGGREPDLGRGAGLAPGPARGAAARTSAPRCRGRGPARARRRVRRRAAGHRGQGRLEPARCSGVKPCRPPSGTPAGQSSTTRPAGAAGVAEAPSETPGVLADPASGVRLRMEARGFPVARHLAGESQPNSHPVERRHARVRHGVRRLADAGVATRDDRSRPSLRRPRRFAGFRPKAGSRSCTWAIARDADVVPDTLTSPAP